MGHTSNHTSLMQQNKWCHVLVLSPCCPFLWSQLEGGGAAGPTAACLSWKGHCCFPHVPVKVSRAAVEPERLLVPPAPKHTHTHAQQNLHSSHTFSALFSAFCITFLYFAVFLLDLTCWWAINQLLFYDLIFQLLEVVPPAGQTPLTLRHKK